ncbi:uncharacterized protein TRIADDRAFT_56898 [Trichoplax adhaerens]|uniref:PHD-type domain-containing protein n=1 Tax=Trichoplax adhaerens TaxID=10228 RepID=B3RWW1_TRIAD|nr:predicted protein [Trichoplax adhaerens]EDV25200.1 predicted protein [Trichoplax adhaerens]|eukprot:XP_002113090.1 predicted protein [Trichoplax adhaerens]
MAFDDVGIDLKEVLEYIGQVDVVPLGQEYYSFPVPVPDKIIYLEEDDDEQKSNASDHIDLHPPNHDLNESTKQVEMMEIDENITKTDTKLINNDATDSVKRDVNDQAKAENLESHDSIENEPEVIVINKRNKIEDLRQRYRPDTLYTSDRKEWHMSNNRAISLASSKEAEMKPTTLSMPMVKPLRTNSEPNKPIQPDVILKSNAASINKTKVKSASKLKPSNSKSEMKTTKDSPTAAESSLVDPKKVMTMKNIVLKITASVDEKKKKKKSFSGVEIIEKAAKLSPNKNKSETNKAKSDSNVANVSNSKVSKVKRPDGEKLKTKRSNEGKTKEKKLVKKYIDELSGVTDQIKGKMKAKPKDKIKKVKGKHKGNVQGKGKTKVKSDGKIKGKDKFKGGSKIKAESKRKRKGNDKDTSERKHKSEGKSKIYTTDDNKKKALKSQDIKRKDSKGNISLKSKTKLDKSKSEKSKIAGKKKDKPALKTSADMSTKLTLKDKPIKNAYSKIPAGIADNSAVKTPSKKRKSEFEDIKPGSAKIHKQAEKKSKIEEKSNRSKKATKSKSNKSSQGKPLDSVKSKPSLPPVYVKAIVDETISTANNATETSNSYDPCPVCHLLDDGSSMVFCDECEKWFHFKCVGLEIAPKEEDAWFCNACRRKKKTGKTSQKFIKK